MNYRFLRLLFITTLALFANTCLANSSLIIGKSITIHSQILDEDRTLLIYLPKSYQKSTDKSYPVLYALDGETHFKSTVGTIDWLSGTDLTSEHIVVAIVNTNRYRDFVFSNVEPALSSKPQNKFINFMSDELVPYIDKNYRTQPFRTLTGHSLGGVAALNTMMTKPNLFQAYVVMSPAIGMELVNFVEQQFEKKIQPSAFVYLTLGNEPWATQVYDKLVGIFNKRLPSSDEWQSDIYQDETHMTTPLRSLPKALARIGIYAGWNVKSELVLEGADKVKQHFQELSNRFGYKLKIPTHIIKQMGYDFLDLEDAKSAITVFKTNIGLNPSAASYEDLAIAFQDAGDLDKALSSQNQAVTFAKNNGDENLQELEEHLEQIKKDIAKD